jgi:bifunctional DNA-binding transcriptional regulator/antitoxin component of YhaV-PrlF toxin-antitoxin module
MRSKCFVCLLLVSLVYGQAAPPTTPPAAGAPAQQNAAPAPGAPAGQSATPAPAPEVKPDDVVITLKGFCKDATQQGDACKTVITRAEFEKLVQGLAPGLSPAARRNLANRYSVALKMSTMAEQRGLDKGPSYEEKMHYAHMQILAQELSSAVQADSQKVSDEDVADYYKKNEASYEQASLQRVFIPHTKQISNAPEKPKPPLKAGTAAAAGTTTSAKSTTATNTKPKPPTEAQKKAAEEAMMKLATTLRARAVKGEDPDKLQKEAFVAAGMPGNTVNTKIEKARRSTLPPTHQMVMDLKPGEVSEVISDPNGGHYIYKMISKETLTLEAVAPDIRKTISTQRYRDLMSGYQRDVDLNDAYFGAARPQGMPSSPMRLGTKPAPAPEHMEDKD